MPTKRPTRFRKAQPLTDQQRFQNVFTALTARGVAFLFDLRGATGVREDRFNDYTAVADNAGTNLWVGEHVGHTDNGGARWGDDGVLYVAVRPGLPWKDVTWVPARNLSWSFNQEHPEVAALLWRLFREQGLDACWYGDEWDCVTIDLANNPTRTPLDITPPAEFPANLPALPVTASIQEIHA